MDFMQAFYNKNKLILAISAVVLGLIAFGYISNRDKSQNDAATTLPELKSAILKIIKPGPLTGTEDREFSYLTGEGTIYWTNVQRQQKKLTELRQNAKLDQAASLKLKDMFDKQYFEHVSPQGKDIAVSVDNVDYKYLIVGENLAQGNFRNDEELVEAWMASPGHRDNILNAKYEEIGVAARRAQFQGRSVWLAVQVFATPTTACPAPDQELKSDIDSRQSTIEGLNGQASKLKAEIDITSPNSPSYQEKVDAYNTLVDQINALMAETKPLIDQYNAQVDSLNKCIND